MAIVTEIRSEAPNKKAGDSSLVGRAGVLIAHGLERADEARRTGAT
jgi:hypothetical protein